jgi:tripartite-type tricarboxylate transporter receptor subunit TctC
MKKLMLAAIAALAALSHDADAADPYFKGRTVSLIVGFGAGGPVDVTTRLYAKYLSDHIPGKPTVIVKNMEGAGSFKAHNLIFEGTKGDGENLLIGPWFPVAQILNLPGVSFKYQDFALVAAYNSGGFLVYARNDIVPGGLKSSADIVKAPALKFAGIQPNFTYDLLGRLTMELFDVRYQYITGYRGSSDIRPALMKNEANVGVDTASGYRTGIVSTMVEPGIVKPLWSIPAQDESGKWIRSPDLPEMPNTIEVYREAFGKDPAGVKWDTLRLVLTFLADMGQVIVGPPNLDKTALADLRTGAYAAFADKGFQEESQKRLGSKLVAVSPERATKIVQSINNIDPALVAHLKAHVESGRSVRQ